MNLNHNIRYAQGMPAPQSIRAESCDKVNNTTKSLIAITRQQQYESLNAGGSDLNRGFEKGRVAATKGSRTGILTKTGIKAVYSPFANQSLQAADAHLHNYVSANERNQQQIYDNRGNRNRHNSTDGGLNKDAQAFDTQGMLDRSDTQR